MTLKEYLELLAKQRELFTPEMISAIECQGRLHDICVQKQEYRDEILDKYNDLIQEGCKKYSLNILIYPTCFQIQKFEWRQLRNY